MVSSTDLFQALINRSSLPVTARIEKDLGAEKISSTPLRTLPSSPF